MAAIVNGGEAAQKAERVACADPLYFLRHYAVITDPRRAELEYRDLPFMLWDRQVELAERTLEAKRKQETLLVNKGRGIGVSWLVLHIVGHAWLFEAGFSAHLGSRKEDYVDDHTIGSLFGKLRYLFESLPSYLLTRDEYDDASSRLIYPSQRSELTGESSNANWGRAGRKTMLVLDEFGHVDPSLQEQIWTGIETVSGCKVVISTPNGRGNKFHALALTLPPEKCIELDWRTDPTRDDEWYRARLLEAGGNLTWDEREQEHSCSFSGVSGQRILKINRPVVEYDDDTPEFAEVLEVARRSWLLVGGMDFGSGPALTVLLRALLSWGDPPDRPPMLWLDSEQFWQRVSSTAIAAEILEKGQEYGGPRIDFGDPAGSAVEHDQESFESALQAEGCPLHCLEAKYNSPFMLHTSIRETQHLFDIGHLRIHRERCPVTLEAVESWEWDLPKSIPLELVNREQIKPRKDTWSHFGDALVRYLVAGALRELEVPTDKVTPFKEATEGLELETFGSVGGTIPGIHLSKGWPSV